MNAKNPSKGYKVGLWIAKNKLVSAVIVGMAIALIALTGEEPKKQLAPLVPANTADQYTPPPEKPKSEDASASARYVCKDFIQRSGYSVQDWGESWNWTTIDNKDGTWSVGARIIGMAPGKGTANMYLTCVTKKNGDQWKLEKLTRLQ